MIAFLCEQYLGNRALIAAEKGIQEGRLLTCSQTHPRPNGCLPTIKIKWFTVVKPFPVPGRRML